MGALGIGRTQDRDLGDPSRRSASAVTPYLRPSTGSTDPEHALTVLIGAWGRWMRDSTPHYPDKNLWDFYERSWGRVGGPRSASSVPSRKRTAWYRKAGIQQATGRFSLAASKLSPGGRGPAVHPLSNFHRASRKGNRERPSRPARTGTTQMTIHCAGALQRRESEPFSGALRWARRSSQNIGAPANAPPRAPVKENER